MGENWGENWVDILAMVLSLSTVVAESEGDWPRE